MTDKSATERLREMLDELGVHWVDSSTVGRYGNHIAKTEWIAFDRSARFTEWGNGAVRFECGGAITPEQAIAATLGGGECELEIKDNMNETESTGAVWWECSSCHWRIEFFHTKWLEHAKFCPECGAKVRKAVKR